MTKHTWKLKHPALAARLELEGGPVRGTSLGPVGRWGLCQSEAHVVLMRGWKQHLGGRF